MVGRRWNWHITVFITISVVAHAGFYLSLPEQTHFNQHSAPADSLTLNVVRLRTAAPEAQTAAKLPETAQPDKTVLMAEQSALKIKPISHSAKPKETEMVPPKKIKPVKPMAKTSVKQPQPSAIKSPPTETASESAQMHNNMQQARMTLPATAVASHASEGIQHDPLAADKTSYLSYLYAKIRQHQFYPKRARRRGNEGKVIVAFEIDALGQINDLHVKQTSGNRHLDKAAIKTIQLTLPLNKPPLAHSADAMSLSVPIEYRLTR